MLYHTPDQLIIETDGNPYTTKITRPDGTPVEGISAVSLDLDAESNKLSPLVIKLSPAVVATKIVANGYDVDVDMEEVRAIVQDILNGGKS